jgi:hypothetical protein
MSIELASSSLSFLIMQNQITLLDLSIFKRIRPEVGQLAPPTLGSFSLQPTRTSALRGSQPKHLLKKSCQV